MMHWDFGEKTTAAELMRRADAVLYEAKYAGRNTFRVASLDRQT